MAKKAFKRLNVDLGNAGILSVDLNKQTDNGKWRWNGKTGNVYPF